MDSAVRQIQCISKLQSRERLSAVSLSLIEAATMQMRKDDANAQQHSSLSKKGRVLHARYLSKKSIPEICPVFAHVEFFLAYRLANVVLHEFAAVPFDEVKTPGIETDVILQPI